VTFTSSCKLWMEVLAGRSDATVAQAMDLVAALHTQFPENKVCAMRHSQPGDVCPAWAVAARQTAQMREGQEHHFPGTGRPLQRRIPVLALVGAIWGLWAGSAAAGPLLRGTAAQPPCRTVPRERLRLLRGGVYAAVADIAGGREVGGTCRLGDAKRSRCPGISEWVQTLRGGAVPGSMQSGTGNPRFGF